MGTPFLAAFAARPMFDVILSSSKACGRARDLADRGWHAGPAYRDVAIFSISARRLNPAARSYVMVSSDTDLDLFGKRIQQAGSCANGEGVSISLKRLFTS